MHTSRARYEIVAFIQLELLRFRRVTMLRLTHLTYLTGCPSVDTERCVQGPEKIDEQTLLIAASASAAKDIQGGATPENSTMATAGRLQIIHPTIMPRICMMADYLKYFVNLLL